MVCIISSLSLISGISALTPLISQGNKFYQLNEDSSKPATSFQIYGVDYQPGGSSEFKMSASKDALSDPSLCQRDAYLLQQLGANAIRIYSINPWINHDECMTIYNNAGIYVLLDINTPETSLHRYDPGDSYNKGYLNNVFGLVDAFKGYPNLMGFIAGNEIISDSKSASQDPKYIRAVIRDVKEYIHKWANRSIPVGYAAADIPEFRKVTWNYLECNANTGNSDTDEFSRADFFGINTYGWCSGVNDYKTSTYGKIKETFKDSSIPVLFTEYGCNTKRPRTFEEVNEGLYGPLAEVIAGGFVYEYSNEVSNYGLVDIDSDGNISILKDYDNLQTALTKNSIPTSTLSKTQANTASLKDAPTCNSDLATKGFDWDLNLPPCPAKGLLSNGGGNQNVGRLTTLSGTVSKTYTIVDASGSTLTPDYNFMRSAKNQKPSSGVHSTSSKSHSKNIGGQLVLPLGLGVLSGFILSLV